MHVLITGARGKVGAAAATAFRAARHRVTLTDIGPASYGPQAPGTLPYIRADLTDYGSTIATVMRSGAEVVVHAAGIPDPAHDPGPVIFANNTLANYNIAEAAVQAGVKRLVYISSETAPGFVTAERAFLPAYLPVDEGLPLRPQDAYALSKALGEHICDALVSRSDVTAVSIRPSLVLAPGDYAQFIPVVQNRPVGPSFNFWSYVDVDDLAELIVLAAESTTSGHEVAYAAQPDNYMGMPFEELVRTAYGDQGPVIRALRQEDSSGISIAKARALFGWAPKHSWRERS